jgi:hypothetical protein
MDRFKYQRWIAPCVLVLAPFIVGPGSCERDVNLGTNRADGSIDEQAGDEATGGKGAGGRTAKDAGGRTERDLCDYSECGSGFDKPPRPRRCSDGSTVAGECRRDSSDNTCHWIPESCPSSFEDACGGCKKGEYCKVLNCGRNEEKGTCVPVPEYCNSSNYWYYEYQNHEACACNGTLYYTDCLAYADNVSIDTDQDNCRDSGCTYGLDQTCNWDPNFPAALGLCHSTGKCSCEGYRQDPNTGKCSLF